MNLFERSQLIDMDETHLALVLLWRNQSFIREVMYHDEKIDMKTHKQWFQSLKSNPAKVVKVFCFDHQPFGLVQFHHDEKNKLCEWGFYIGEEKAPKGLGTIMGMLALDLAFQSLKVRKVCGEVLAINKKSIQFHKKLGFQEEGFLKKHKIKNNQPVDVYLFALFSEEWQQQRERVINQMEGWML